MPCFLKIEPETYGWTRVQLCVVFAELESGDLLSGHYGYPVPMEILTGLAQQHKLSIQIPQRGSEKQIKESTKLLGNSKLKNNEEKLKEQFKG